MSAAGPGLPADAWTVVGAGAVGGTLAHALAAAGTPVRVVDTDRAHVAAIQRSGLEVRALDGSSRRVGVPAVHPDDLPGGVQLGRVLLAVKAQATAGALGWLAPRLAGDGFVVGAQNGFGERQIAAAVGADRTVACFVDLFADLVAPGVVAAGGGGTVVLGELDGRPSARVDRAVAELSAWGPVTAGAHVEGLLWSKLAYTAAAAMASVVDDPVGQVLGAEAGTALALVHEVYRVALAEGGAPQDFDAWEAAPLLPGADPAAARAALGRMASWLSGQPKNRTGIWRDLVVRRRPTEVPALLAPVLDGAVRAGLACPGLHAVLDVYRDLEAGRLRTGPTALAPIRAAVRRPEEDPT